MKKLWMGLMPAMLLMAACASPATNTPPPTAPIPASTTQPGSFQADGVIASAKAEPQNQTQISFVISGTIQEVFVKEGDVVSAGQKLIEMYAPDLELGVTSAELNAKAAELEYAYWIPPRLNRPPERKRQAAAELEFAKAQLETAKAAFAQAVLSAPFDGTVIEVRVQAGEYARTGQVVLILGSTQTMQIRTTDLSERDVVKVKIGQPASVFIEALNLTIRGKVARISPISEIVGGDVVYPVILELDEQPQGLLWGMSAEVQIETE